MRLLHTSDWHLGKRLNDVSRLEEQRAVLGEIVDIARREEVDVVVVAGDLFDTFNPPTEAVELFYSTLKRLANNGKCPVIAIAGNHDSPDRIEAPDPLARECGIIFAGYPNSLISPFELETGLKVSQSCEGFIELKLPNYDLPLRVLLTPYSNEFRLKTYLGEENSEEALRAVLQRKWEETANRYCDTKGVNVLVSHLFFMKEGGELPEEPEDERPILHVGGAQVVYSANIPQQIQYSALGHLHRKQLIDTRPAPVVYSGSPLSYSFSEANQQKYIIIADIEPGKPAHIQEIELKQGKPLLRKRAESVEEAVDWLAANPNTWVELTMATETYLTAEERKRLYTVHDGIVLLIPDVQNKLLHGESTLKAIDLSKSMEELFRDYFRSDKGQEPGDSIMQLFKEILAEEENAL